ETQESYGNRSQPAGNAGKPNHDEMGLIQQDRPSSLPVSDKSVDQSESRTKHHISSLNIFYIYLVIFGKVRN
ncbi:AT-rich interactive domain-containing protein 1B-like, partial [Tachysurus ichikawai]